MSNPVRVHRCGKPATFHVLGIEVGSFRQRSCIHVVETVSPSRAQCVELLGNLLSGAREGDFGTVGERYSPRTIFDSISRNASSAIPGQYSAKNLGKGQSGY